MSRETLRKKLKAREKAARHKAKAAEKVCKVPGCTKPARARGKCNAHYLRAWYKSKRARDEAAGIPSRAEARKKGQVAKAAREAKAIDAASQRDLFATVEEVGAAFGRGVMRGVGQR